jgi:hypothetical protein
VLGDAQSFAAGLQKRGARTELISDYSVRVFGPEEEISPAVWKAAADAGIAVRSIVPSRTSLEEVFLKAVRETSHADS